MDDHPKTYSYTTDCSHSPIHVGCACACVLSIGVGGTIDTSGAVMLIVRGLGDVFEPLGDFGSPRPASDSCTTLADDPAPSPCSCSISDDPASASSLSIGLAKPFLASASPFLLSPSTSSQVGGGTSSASPASDGVCDTVNLVAALLALRLLRCGGGCNGVPAKSLASLVERKRTCSGVNPASGASKLARTAEFGKGEEITNDWVDAHGDSYGDVEPVMVDNRDECG